MRGFLKFLPICLVLGVIPLVAQKLDPNTEKTKLQKPAEPAAATDEKGSEKEQKPFEAGDEMLPAKKLKADREKSAEDRLPFGPPQIEKRENIFGDNKEKKGILDKVEYQIGFIAEGAGFNNTGLAAARRVDRLRRFRTPTTSRRWRSHGFILTFTFP